MSWSVKINTCLTRQIKLNVVAVKISLEFRKKLDEQNWILALLLPIDPNNREGFKSQIGVRKKIQGDCYV